MNWRNPKKEMPENDQLVWVMLKPHKFRGSLKESLSSVQIVAGWVEYSTNCKKCMVNNQDEYGQGCVSYTLGYTNYGEEEGIAWMPIEEMILPNF